MATLIKEDRNWVYTTDDVVECQCDGVEECFVIGEEKLGEGGNAVVYKCQERSTGEDFAIKIQVLNKGTHKERFAREVRVLKAAEHEQLMSCRAVGELRLSYEKKIFECPYVIMPVAELNLKKLIEIRGRLPIEELNGQFCGMSDALAALHHTAIHRDIKPENILIRGGAWVLSDFGLCKFLGSDADSVDITLDNEKIGPKYWMSPESMNRMLGNKDEISTASDVFQMASVFWFAATGRHPTGIVSRADWSGPAPLYDVLASALSHSPGLRPKDGTDFHQKIEDAVRHA